MKYRKFIIDKIIVESSTIKSFYLKPADGKELKKYLPGQFVSVRIKLLGQDEIFVRNYTLSDSPHKDYYRLTIKREEKGVVSRFFHYELEPGDTIEVSDPSGQFYFKSENAKQVLFLSGGVGITPMMSMLEEILEKPIQSEIIFLHSSQNKSVQPFYERLSEISNTYKNVRVVIFHSEPTNDEIIEQDYYFKGLISPDDLQKLVPDIALDCYLCGPESFMQAMYEYLINLGIDKERIFYEFFGDVKKLGTKADNHSTNTYKIKFAKSEVEVDWSEASYSILELAEKEGLKPEYGCRIGACETCQLDLLGGSVSYDPEPLAEIPDGKVLICCAKPLTDIELDC